MLREILRKAGGAILPPLMTMWMKTLKIKGGRMPEVPEGRFIGVFWHGKMLAGWYLFKNHNPAALVSLSPDGELLVKLLKAWNYRVIRGSSHREGSKALEDMINTANNEKNIIITPDGPTGPARKFKAGAVITAKKTGLPLLLCGIGYSKKFTLKSWDSFELPVPFSRVRVEFSDPIFIDNNLQYKETSDKILRAEALLNELTNKAELLCLK